MKSILQEGNSIAKAIENAWKKAGEPKEFTVKIFNKEIKNFFGFTKKAATISISYDLGPQDYLKLTKSNPRINTPVDRACVLPNEAQRMKDRVIPTTFKRIPQPQPHKQQSQQELTQQEEFSNENQKFAYGKWNSELVKDLNTWIEELIKLMQLKTTFTLTVNQHLLKIIFNSPVVENGNDERLLFSGLAYLLMQFLKRKYKKKFGGHRLAITSIRS